MIDPARIRKDPDGVAAALAKRGTDIDLGEFLALDEAFTANQLAIEDARAQRNAISAEIGKTVREGGDVDAVKARAAEISATVARLETEAEEAAAARQVILDGFPNTPADEVPAGGKDANTVLRHVQATGAGPQGQLDHMELSDRLGLVDHERGVKLNGNGAWIYTGPGAILEWALLNYFVTSHIQAGYTFILPPHTLLPENGYTAGQFPKFADDVFTLEREEEDPRRFLIPTAETALANLHRDETLPEAELPLRYFSYTPCYRSEHGGYRTTERGTLRGSQFNKVEMFILATPSTSEAAHTELLGRAESLVHGLGLEYQVSLLAAGDTSASMAKTYDVEVKIPSIGFIEVSSVSNAHDYQARRGGIRFKAEQKGRSRFLHTLNASGLATSRLMPAIVEQNQTADGDVVVPEVLRPWVGTDLLTAAG